MSEIEKCLTDASIEILFRIAEKDKVLSYSRQDDTKIISSLVESGHIFQGKLLNDSPTSNAYSITKKGFLALQCNLLWSTYDGANAHQQVAAHVNNSKLDCHQICLHRSNAIEIMPNKMNVTPKKSALTQVI